MLIKLQSMQQDIAELDKFYIRKLNEATQDNAILRSRLANGTHRVYITGARCKPAHPTAPSSSVGNGAAVELSTGTGEDILTIRQGIISDQQKLKYLQDYIRRITADFKKDSK